MRPARGGGATHLEAGGGVFLGEGVAHGGAARDVDDAVRETELHELRAHECHERRALVAPQLCAAAAPRAA